MQLHIHEVLLSLFVLLSYVAAKVDQIDFPVELARCYNDFHKKTSISKSVGHSVQFRCYQGYRLKTSTDRKYKGKVLGLKDNAYIKTLGKQAEQVVRKKRQANNNVPPRRRRRKELRMMTREEIDRYFAAINVLKSTEMTVGNETMNRFDIIASFHNGEQLGAHGGCGFGPWHRAYLIMYEEALMQVDDKVTLPYWDSTLEYYMEDSTQSVLWSQYLMGNGDGLVTSGPFANWNSPVGPLVRNVGVSGKTYSEQDIRNVTERTRYGEICGDMAPAETDMEFLHGPIHIYVDGQMGIIETAAFEPIFYMHHAFVDHIWELFRDNQRRNNVDPTTDYPDEFFGDIFHAPDEDMGIGTMALRDGLANRFIDDIYHYQPRPTCQANNRHCGSDFLKCANVEGAYRCVSKTVEEYEYDLANGGGNNGGGNQGGGNQGGGNQGGGNQGGGNQGGGNQGGGNQGGGNQGGGNQGGGNQGGGNQGGGSCPKPKPKPDDKPTHKPVQNSFCANGKSDTREWVYLPIRVTYQRPPDFKRYNSYPILDGKPRVVSDIYAPSAYNAVNKYIRPGHPENYGKCKSSTSGAGEMYIQSDGLNYDGTYKEYAVIDNRLAISMSVAYVAVKAPSRSQPSDVLISAFDSCGRVCHATCLIPGTNYYRPCSGAIRVSEDVVRGRGPQMYGQNFGNSVLNVWDFASSQGASCPQFNIDKIYVSFFCDYSDRWPWEHALKQKLPPPPPKRKSPPPSVNPDKIQQAPQNNLKKCQVGACQIERENCDAPCENMQNYRCVNMCNAYARCFYQKYYISYCNWGHYNEEKKMCMRGQGHCTQDEYNNGRPAVQRHAHAHGPRHATRNRQATRNRWVG